MRCLQWQPAETGGACRATDGKHIGDVAKMSIDGAAVVHPAPHHLNKNQSEIARRILREINERLGFLQNVGLKYLTLSRITHSPVARASASGSASQIGSGLTGGAALDEPSIGLHQQDNSRLLDTLKRLRIGKFGGRRRA